MTKEAGYVKVLEKWIVRQALNLIRKGVENEALHRAMGLDGSCFDVTVWLLWSICTVSRGA
jgi:hypothetical protein